MLGDALDELEEERPRMTDLYFVGFAPYAREDVFRKDMEVARDLFDDRFDTDGRSIVLINNPRDGAGPAAGDGQQPAHDPQGDRRDDRHAKTTS